MRTQTHMDEVEITETNFVPGEVGRAKLWLQGRSELHGHDTQWSGLSPCRLLWVVSMSACLASGLWTCLHPLGPSGSSEMSSCEAMWQSSTAGTGKKVPEWGWRALVLRVPESEGLGSRRRSSV